jgi:nucleoside-diphosphate-sugar epimerase
MRILLTGSSGWLGRFLAPRLRCHGHEVIGLDIAPAPNTDYIGSVADGALIGRVFAESGIEAVIHSGALHKPDIDRYPAQCFIDANVTGTLHLLEAATAANSRCFIFTSTTSLMISAEVHAGQAGGAARAAWLTEDFGPLEPRNIYGVTKLAAEHLCRLHHHYHGLPILILRTARFFPEEDDMAHAIAQDGPNTKANEFLNRRLTVEDAADAHVAALSRAADLGFDTFILSAPPPFAEQDCEELIRDAASVIGRYFPHAAELYERVGWSLPSHIDRVYVPARAEQLLGFRCRTDFRAILDALARNLELPFAHDPSYVSPKETAFADATGRGDTYC